MPLLLLINLIVTWFTVRFFLKLAQTRTGLEHVAIWSAVLFVVSACMTSVACLIQMGLTFVFAMVLLPFKPREAITKRLFVVAPLVGYVFAGLMVVPELRERAELRRQFPIESLADRLKYEEKNAALATLTKSAPLLLSNGVERRLRELDDRTGGNIRAHMLSSLHDTSAEMFVIGKGFGPIRMLGVRRQRVELPNLDPIPFEPVPEGESTFQANGSVNTSELAFSGQRLDAENLLRMHVESENDFFDSERMGYVRGRNHVIGFQAHRFHGMPGAERTTWHPFFKEPVRRPPGSFSRRNLRQEWRRDWAIVRLELIGILRHEAPVAYVSDHLPELEELAEYPTRPLTDFESSALERLRTEEDIVIDDQTHRVRMVGSLRAGHQCQKCHNVQRGELLGALSYELRPE